MAITSQHQRETKFYRTVVKTFWRSANSFFYFHKFVNLKKVVTVNYILLLQEAPVKALTPNLPRLGTSTLNVSRTAKIAESGCDLYSEHSTSIGILQERDAKDLCGIDSNATETKYKCFTKKFNTLLHLFVPPVSHDEMRTSVVCSLAIGHN